MLVKGKAQSTGVGGSQTPGPRANSATDALILLIGLDAGLLRRTDRKRRVLEEVLFFGKTQQAVCGLAPPCALFPDRSA
jgi:hypothetical protein